jgi:predicted molibdopterin-dependent oxidoreductase YjgC
MNKLLYLSCLLLLIGINQIYAQTGSITGNVYWKYNDYVGNKADAGSEITAILLSNPETKYNATCDLQGNYKIEGLNSGRYFLIIKSRNTKQHPVTYSRLFEVYKRQLDTVLKIKASDFRKDLQFQIDSLYKAQIELVYKYGKNEIKMGKYMKENGKIDNLLMKKTKEWFDDMPQEMKLKIDAFSNLHESFHYQIIELASGKNETVITDFGITYY